MYVKYPPIQCKTRINSFYGDWEAYNKRRIKQPRQSNEDREVMADNHIGVWRNSEGEQFYSCSITAIRLMQPISVTPRAAVPWELWEIKFLYAQGVYVWIREKWKGQFSPVTFLLLWIWSLNELSVCRRTHTHWVCIWVSPTLFRLLQMLMMVHLKQFLFF